MDRKYCSLAVPIVAIVLATFTQSAHAQRAGFIRLFRPYHQVVLAQLDEVEAELKLTDEQQTKAVELNDTLNEERGALFQEAAGDFDSIREDMATLNEEIAAEFNEALDETQKKRLQEIFVQANGAAALFDEKVAAALELTEAQVEQLYENRSASRGDFQGIDWQSLSEEEVDAKVDELIAGQDEKYAAVLTGEQPAEFEKLQGEKIEIDLGNMPNPFGG
jgi:hypothetical protein